MHPSNSSLNLDLIYGWGESTGWFGLQYFHYSDSLVWQLDSASAELNRAFNQVFNLVSSLAKQLKVSAFQLPQNDRCSAASSLAQMEVIQPDRYSDVYLPN